MIPNLGEYSAFVFNTSVSGKADRETLSHNFLKSPKMTYLECLMALVSN